MPPIFIIARFTWLEAARSRLLWLVLTLALVSLGTSFLIREMAITDSHRMQLSFLAASLRMISVFLTAAAIVSSLQREFNDKGPTLLLARAVPRSHYVLGKVLGLGLFASVIALCCALPLALLAPGAIWWAWTASLLMEHWIIASLAVFCAISLRSVTAGLALCIGFYLLAKSMAALQLISRASLSAAETSHRYLSSLLDIIALLLPRLDQYTQTRWLLEPSIANPALSQLLLQTLLFTALLSMAAVFDLYRKNL